MRIDREHIVQVLLDRGMTEQADRARRVLGPHADTRDDAALLRELGIDPDRRTQGGVLATLPDR